MNSLKPRSHEKPCFEQGHRRARVQLHRGVEQVRLDGFAILFLFAALNVSGAQLANAQGSVDTDREAMVALYDLTDGNGKRGPAFAVDVEVAAGESNGLTLLEKRPTYWTMVWR